MESGEAGRFRVFLRRYRTLFMTAATLTLFCMVAYAIMNLTDEIRYDDVVEALVDTRASSILLALVFTALSFSTLIFYDLNAIDYIGKKLPLPHVALTAFSAYAVGNTAGFGALSGGAIRYRAYSRLGLSPEDIGRVIAFVTLSFGLGLASVAAIALVVVADQIGPLINSNALLLRIIAGAILIALGVGVYLGRNGRAINLGPIAVDGRIRVHGHDSSSLPPLISRCRRASSTFSCHRRRSAGRCSWRSMRSLSVSAFLRPLSSLRSAAR
jgi:phosphatidylglycerol lysyltransferase